MWSVAPVFGAASSGMTSAQMNEAVTFAVASGLVGYVFARYSRRVVGIAPWNWPPLLWGAVALLIPGFGLLLEVIARMTTRQLPRTGGGDPNASGNFFGGRNVHPPQPGQPTSAWPPPQPGQPVSPWPPQPGQPTSAWPPPQPGQPVSPWPPQPGQPAGTWPPPPQPQPSGAPGGAEGSPVPASWPPPTGSADTPGWAQQQGPWPQSPTWPQQPGPWAQPAGDPGGQPQVSPPAAPAWPLPLGPEAFQSQVGYPGPEGWQPESPLGAASGPPPLFGWYADPAGTHEQRYWDGRQWSHRVSDNSVRGDDPLPPYGSGRGPAPTATAPTSPGPGPAGGGHVTTPDT
jgi:hypothetical protein